MYFLKVRQPLCLKETSPTMHSLTGQKIKLRALELSDLDDLYLIENNESFWLDSHTQKPYSKHLLKQYIQNSHLDIYEAKQLRFVIESLDTSKVVGLVDLFDFDPKHLRAGVGIVILPSAQQKGYATESLELLHHYACQHLHLHQLYANIISNNQISQALFTKLHYTHTGTRKKWIRDGNTFKDVAFYQLFLPSLPHYTS